MSEPSPTPVADRSRVRVERETLIDHLIASALEYGFVDDLVAPPDPHSDSEVDFSLKDVDSWDIDPDGDRIILTGRTTGTWSERVSRATRHHPAEYEQHEIPVKITVIADFEASPLGEYTIETVPV